MRVLAAMFVPLVLLLTGCGAWGTLEVRSADEVVVDVTLTGLSRRACAQIGSAAPGVVAEPRPGAGGTRDCRVTGTVQPSDLLVVEVVAGDEFYLVTADFGAGAQPGDLDLTLVLPGRVLDSNGGTVDGNTVRFTGDTAEVLTGELRVLSAAGPPVPWAAVWAGTGALAGVAGTLLALRLRRRAATVRPGGPTAPAPLADDPLDAPDPTTAGTDVAAAPVTALAAAPVDPAVWSRPPGPAGTQRPTGQEDDGAGAANPRPDHSVWAPPEQG